MNRRFFFFAIAVLGFFSLPFMVSLFWAWRGGLQYTGGHLLTPGDYYVYLSYLEQARQGEIAFQNLYTTEAFPSVFNLFWFVVGWGSKLLSLSPAWGYHASRVILGFVFLLAVWKCSLVLYPDRRRAMIVMALVLAAGFGPFMVPFLDQSLTNGGYIHYPPDLWMPEAIGFLLLMNSPHIIASILLELGVLWAFATGVDRRSRSRILVSGICGLALIQFHPFHLPVVGAVIGSSVIGWSLVQRKIATFALGSALIVGLMMSPSIAYHVWLLRTFDGIAQRAAENLNYTPLPHLMVVGYGFVLLFAILGAWQKRHRVRTSFMWLVIWLWFLIQPFLFYGPLQWNRRLTQAWFLPLAFLGASVLDRFLKWIQEKSGSRMAGSLLIVQLGALLLFFSPIYFVAEDIVILHSLYRRKQAPFLSASESEMLSALKQGTETSDVILADRYHSNRFPGLIGRRVFAGHGPETLGFSQKEWETFAFYQSTGSAKQKIAWLEQRGITVVVFDREALAKHPLLADRANVIWESEQFVLWRR